MATKKPQSLINNELNKMHEFNFSRAGLADDIGLIGASVGQENLDPEQRSEKKNREDLQAAIAEARRIQDLQDIIDRANEGITAGEQLKSLIKNKDFNKDDPAHIQILITAGFDPNDDLPTLDDVDAKIENWKKDKDDAQNTLDTLQKAKNIHSVEARSERLKEFSKGRQADTNIAEIIVESTVSPSVTSPSIDDEWMSFASELDETPITTEVTLSADFGHAVSNTKPQTPQVAPDLLQESVLKDDFTLGG